MTKTIQIFKQGTHTAVNGATINFGEQDLQSTVAAYNPDIHEAPLVVGHPKLDGPAYGWVRSLTFAEGLLNADTGQVDAEFAEMVNKGHFKHVSASFYLPTAPNNPVPGIYYLRHVGFLGAQPPAVKGLKAVSFGEAEDGVVEFGDWADRVEAGLFRKLREWIIGKFGQDEADKALPGWDVDIVQEEAAQRDVCEPETGDMPAFSEKETTNMLTPEQIAAKEAEFVEREATLSKQEAAGRHTAHISFAEGLVKEGILLPTKKEQAVAMLDFAAGLDDTHVVEFGEGDGKQSAHAAEMLRGYFSDQPKIVEFGEVAGGAVEEEAGSASFASAPGYTVDAAGLELHNKALSYQAKNPGTDYMTAVKSVQ